MYKSNSKIDLAVMLTVASLIWAGGWPSMPARAQHAGHDHAGHGHQDRQPGSAGHAATNQRGPHGGQMTAAEFYHIEVVFQPRETRVYLYGPAMRPVTARGAEGQVAMRVRGRDQVFRYALKYVAPAAGSRSQDYLAVAVDVSRLRDGDMRATFELAGLPDRRQPQVSFTQTFALSRAPLQVTVAALSAADRAGVARQQVCPVSGGKLGSMGEPIKLLVGDQPLYVCCKGCIKRVQENPEPYLRKVAPVPRESGRTTSPNQMTVTTATAADQAAIARQQVCAVSGGRLGAMGTPIKMSANGQSLFVCCKGCIGKVEKNPEHYLAKAAQLRTGR